MSEESAALDASNTCVLCCHVSEVWVVGKCNHATCLSCSARMRVLCEQKDCPVCRLALNQVVVLSRVQPFQRFSYGKWPSKVIKYGMYFESWALLDMFYYITDHRCQVCPHLPPQKSLKRLKEHIRCHGLYFCEICTDGLKLFPAEFKMYTRSELIIHRRQGDADDKSYKGHPYCQFCDERYLDKDTLHMHLRKTHFWCHFCESEGKQEYYVDCHSLKRHFKEAHFLCEEGDCMEEILTSAFKNEIDLKAHRASAHSKGMSKAEAKQARALPVEFSIVGHHFDNDLFQSKRRGQSAIGVTHGRGDRDGRAPKIREKEERELAVALTNSVRTSSERSQKCGRNLSPPFSNKKLCAQGNSHGVRQPPPTLVPLPPPFLHPRPPILHPRPPILPHPPPVPPPGFQVLRRSNDSDDTLEKDSSSRSKNGNVEGKEDITEDQLNDSWPLLGGAGDPPPSPPSPPPPPGLEDTHRKEHKEGYSMKVLENRTKDNMKQSPQKPILDSYSSSSSSSVSTVSGSRIFEEIRQALGYNQEKFKEFQTLSGWYRNGGVSIQHYNSQCEELLGRQWHVIGPQLAKVMPRGESREKLVSYFAPNTSHRNGLVVNESAGSKKKKTKKINKTSKKDEPGASSAWVTVGSGVGRPQTTIRKHGQTVFSEEDYPSLSTAAKVPPQSKVTLHNPWNVQVHT